MVEPVNLNLLGLDQVEHVALGRQHRAVARAWLLFSVMTIWSDMQVGSGRAIETVR